MHGAIRKSGHFVKSMEDQNDWYMISCVILKESSQKLVKYEFHRGGNEYG